MTLEDFFKEYPRTALAFSGGVDSVFLLWAGVHYGAEIQPYYVKSEFQPQFEYEDAVKVAEKLGVTMKVLPLRVLDCENVAANPEDRCYHCKNQIFGKILKAAAEDGYSVVLDGTNASDDAGDRPGMRALKEMKVLSPLRLCGLTKSEIRRQSQSADLFTWNKPAYACLATRMEAGVPIRAEVLEAVEKSEAWLDQCGFRDFRVRVRGDGALVQVIGSQRAMALDLWPRINEVLGAYFSSVRLDEADRAESVKL